MRGKTWGETTPAVGEKPPKTIRAVLTYVQKKLQKSGNKAAQAALCCLSCFFWCLEKCVKFINKNAYIQVCVYFRFMTGQKKLPPLLCKRFAICGCMCFVSFPRLASTLF